MELVILINRSIYSTVSVTNCMHTWCTNKKQPLRKNSFFLLL